MIKNFKMRIMLSHEPRHIRFRYSGRNVPAWYQNRMKWMDVTWGWEIRKPTMLMPV